MTGGKIALLIAGLVLALLGFGAAVGGGGILWTHSVHRGPDGSITSPTYELGTDGYALTAEEIHLGTPTPGDWLWSDRFEVRFTVTPAAEEPVFIGVAPRAEVDAYLRDVAHSEVSRLGVRTGDVAYRDAMGSTAPPAPGAQGFWAASAEGPGTQTMSWEAEPGSWAVVVMNADAEPGVAVQARLGAQADFLLPLGLVLLVGGLLLLGTAAVLIVLAAAGTAPARAPAAQPTPAAQPAAGATARPKRYPLAIEGDLDEPLSRGLWLVKWLLIIPHVFVLAFLWLAFAILTVVAGFAILFTGRYPRGLFDFNVGVLRWTWRVGYYSYSALGTDRYPPFSLDAVPYPAGLQIEYPERLSRGLVLVKWWLLAIPHYLIVGLLVGGGLSWRTDSETWGTLTLGGGGGIIGVLVFVAGIVVLVRARYPQGLFDLVMGLNRWVYRVVAYAALMTDEYPPFRLDPGGPEPQPVPPPPPGPPPADARTELAHR